MSSLATFAWPGESWEDVRSVSKIEFAARYGVPVRVVRTLFRRRCGKDRRPLQYRPDPAPAKKRAKPQAAVEQITQHLRASEEHARIASLPLGEIEGIVDEVIPWTPELRAAEELRTRALAEAHRRLERERQQLEEEAKQQRDKQRRRQQRLAGRAQRRRRRRGKLEARPKDTPVYYACRATHHEHCKGKTGGVSPCGCRCHLPQHAEWRTRRLWAWEQANPPLPEDGRPARPTSDDELIRSTKQWNQEQRDLARMRQAKRAYEFARARPPSLASHPISEEDVAAIFDIADNVVYQWGRPNDVWIESLGDEAVAVLERLSHYTDPRAKTDLWWQHETEYWWAHFPQSHAQQSDYQRERRREFREAGLCTQCGKVEPEGEGRAMCDGCAAIARAASRRYQARQTARAREKYQQRRRQGLCGTCGERPDDGAAMCERCQAAKRQPGLAYRARNRHGEPYYVRKQQQYRTRVAAGLCGHCGAPQLESRTICARCQERERASKARYLNRKRLAYPRLRGVRQRMATALAGVGRGMAAALAARESRDSA